MLDGPFSGGRVRGLRIPINGRIGGNGGGFAFGARLHRTRFAALQAGALRLGPTRLPLCPVGPAILYSAGGPLVVGAERAIVRGWPAASASRRSRSPPPMPDGRRRRRFSATRMAMRLGKPKRRSCSTPRLCAGPFDGRGVGGTFAGADAIIGRVPLLLSDAAGKWSVRNGDLTSTAR